MPLRKKCFSCPVFLKSPRIGYFAAACHAYSQKTYPVFLKLKQIRYDWTRDAFFENRVYGFPFWNRKLTGKIDTDVHILKSCILKIGDEQRKSASDLDFHIHDFRKGLSVYSFSPESSFRAWFSYTQNRKSPNHVYRRLHLPSGFLPDQYSCEQ